MKKSTKRFEYLAQNAEPAKISEPNSEGVQLALETDDVQSVPRGEGRMAQDRTQLNVRIPTALKRRAAAKAALEGRTLGDVLEEFLQNYVSDRL
jgi:hypothetical protein